MATRQPSKPIHPGQAFGLLIAETIVGRTKYGTVLWFCRCRCGKTLTVTSSNLRNQLSCGCRNQTHGHTKGGQLSLTYSSWKTIFQRTNNSKNRSYVDYGARGIKVCKRWRVFENFFADMGERPSKLHSLERRKNNRGYCKSNCCWATATEQGNNQRSNHILRFRGEKLTVSQWARKLNIHPNTLFARIRYGWAVSKILTTPVKRLP